MTIADKRRYTLTPEMPIRIDALDGEDQALPVKPGTNAHELLEALAEHPEFGFTASELAELTDVPAGSVSKTLSRLEEDGLVRRVEGYWTVADDVVATSLASLVSLEAIEARYGDDAYGQAEDYDDLPDLGENA